MLLVCSCPLIILKLHVIILARVGFYSNSFRLPEWASLPNIAVTFLWTGCYGGKILSGGEPLRLATSNDMFMVFCLFEVLGIHFASPYFSIMDFHRLHRYARPKIFQFLRFNVVDLIFRKWGVHKFSSTCRYLSTSFKLKHPRGKLQPSALYCGEVIGICRAGN